MSGDDDQRRYVRRQADQAVAEFISQLEEDSSSGVPPPPQIRISEVSGQAYEFDNLNAEND